jgi:hypothetical protein
MLGSKIENAQWAEKRPQRVLELEKQPQREMSCCGCFKTTTTRCDVREKATTRNVSLWLL